MTLDPGTWDSGSPILVGGTDVKCGRRSHARERRDEQGVARRSRHTPGVQSASISTPTPIIGRRRRTATQPCAPPAARFDPGRLPRWVGGGVTRRVVVAMVAIVSACGGVSSGDAVSGTTTAESVVASTVSVTTPVVPTIEVTAVEVSSSEPDAPSLMPTRGELVVAPMSLTPSGAFPTKVLVGHGDGFVSVTADGSAVEVASSGDGLCVVVAVRPSRSWRSADVGVGNGTCLALVGWDPVGNGGVSIWMSYDDGGDLDRWHPAGFRGAGVRVRAGITDRGQRHDG